MKSDPVMISLVQPTSRARETTALRSSGWRCVPWYLPRKMGSARLIPIYEGMSTTERGSPGEDTYVNVARRVGGRMAGLLRGWRFR